MDQKCIGPGPCKITPLDRNLPLARSIQITSPSLQERRDRAAYAAERRIRTQRKSRRLSTPHSSRRSSTPRSSRRSSTPRSSRRSATPRSSRRSSNSSPAEEGVAEFVNDLEDYNYNDGLFLRTGEGLYVRPPNQEIRSRMDNLSREARIKRTVEGDRGVAPLIDYMRAECIGAQCTPLHNPLYYRELKNRARHSRQRDLQRRLVRTDIPQSRQQRTLRSRQHDVADRLSLIDEGLDNDVMSRVHHFLKKKGHDLGVNNRYLERRGW